MPTIIRPELSSPASCFLLSGAVAEFAVISAPRNRRVWNELYIGKLLKHDISFWDCLEERESPARVIAKWKTTRRMSRNRPCAPGRTPYSNDSRRSVARRGPGGDRQASGAEGVKPPNFSHCQSPVR